MGMDTIKSAGQRRRYRRHERAYVRSWLVYSLPMMLVVWVTVGFTLFDLGVPLGVKVAGVIASLSLPVVEVWNGRALARDAWAARRGTGVRTDA